MTTSSSIGSNRSSGRDPASVSLWTLHWSLAARSRRVLGSGPGCGDPQPPRGGQVKAGPHLVGRPGTHDAWHDDGSGPLASGCAQDPAGRWPGKSAEPLRRPDPGPSAQPSRGGVVIRGRSDDGGRAVAGASRRDASAQRRAGLRVSRGAQVSAEGVTSVTPEIPCQGCPSVELQVHIWTSLAPAEATASVASGSSLFCFTA